MLQFFEIQIRIVNEKLFLNRLLVVLINIISKSEL